MTKQKEIYFHFHDQNTGHDYRFLTTMKDDSEWEDWSEEDLDQNDSIIATIEEDYCCVHDCFDADGKEEDEQKIFIGFTTYELETEEAFIHLLKKWKETFVTLGWANEDTKIEKVINPKFID